MSKEMLENKLIVLSNLPMQSFFRAVDMLVIGFGDIIEVTNWRGQIEKVAQYRIHIQSPWRLLLDETVLIASSDIYEPNTETEWSENFDWDVFGANLFDELCKKKIEKLYNQIFVNEIILDEYGGMRMIFDSGHVLELFSDTSNQETELWRFFESGKMDSHFVVYVNRVEYTIS